MKIPSSIEEDLNPKFLSPTGKKASNIPENGTPKTQVELDRNLEYFLRDS